MQKAQDAIFNMLYDGGPEGQNTSTFYKTLQCLKIHGRHRTTFNERRRHLRKHDNILKNGSQQTSTLKKHDISQQASTLKKHDI